LYSLPILCEIKF